MSKWLLAVLEVVEDVALVAFVLVAYDAFEILDTLLDFEIVAPAEASCTDTVAVDTVVVAAAVVVEDTIVGCILDDGLDRMLVADAARSAHSIVDADQIRIIPDGDPEAECAVD